MSWSIQHVGKAFSSFVPQKFGNESKFTQNTRGEPLIWVSKKNFGKKIIFGHFIAAQRVEIATSRTMTAQERADASVEAAERGRDDANTVELLEFNLK